MISLFGNEHDDDDDDDDYTIYKIIWLYINLINSYSFNYSCINY